ncbi:MAG: NFACT family protein [Candidatus Altiarchaeota archaeon]
MKEGLSSIDVRILAGEVAGVLTGARFEKAYQVGSKELLLRFYVPGSGTRDLVLAPNYFCITGYTRAIPQNPSSFAMQLRKRLGGLRVSEVRQHGFDRIIEMVFDGRERLILIAELFSKGNVILCDEGFKIIGLLEWQKWRHRTLGVGKAYEYPPSGVNILDVGLGEFNDIMSSEEKPVVSTIASRFGVGGFFAEGVCLNAGVDKEVAYPALDDASRKSLWDSFKSLVDDVLSRSISPILVSDEGGYVDVQPFKSRQYDGMLVEDYDSLNDAVDEFFSSREAFSVGEGMTSAAESRKVKVEMVLKQQEDSMKRFEESSVVDKSKGDLIYQHYGEIDSLMKLVSSLRKQGLADSQVMEELGKTHEGRLVKSLDGLELVLEL